MAAKKLMWTTSVTNRFDFAVNIKVVYLLLFSEAGATNQSTTGGDQHDSHQCGE